MKIYKKKPIINENNSDNDDEEDYKETPKWWQETEEIKIPKNGAPSVTEQILIELKDEAKKCNETEINNYNLKNAKTNSNFKWMKTVINKGTVADKIAAFTVTVQDNPICNLETIRNMVNTIKVGKKKECFSAMETLTELFLNDLLKPNKKLTPFHAQPLGCLTEISSGNAIKRRKILSSWYFEDQLKEIYVQLIIALNKAAQDTVDNNKEKAITAMFKLLCGNPEQEQNLLSYLINKLGDPSQKVASKAIYCLTQLLFKHSNMQKVVLKQVEKLLFRSNISTRTQYYCLCFLSQFYLNNDDVEVAKSLIQVYLAFFKSCVKKGEVDSRMMSALLMGINRAYPYSQIKFEEMSEHIDTLYRLVHLANFNIGLQVLMLLFHVSGENMIDRFYSALYKKLTDSKLLTTTHQAMLLSLLYKSLLKDQQIERVKMFIKRLLQIAQFVQPNFTCGILFLISQLIGKQPKLLALTMEKIDLEIDGDEEKYYDIKDEEVEVDLLNSLDDDVDEPKPDPALINIEFKGSSWMHQKKSAKNLFKYNPLARNPLYGGGDYLSYTELLNLKTHFHPTVALWANQILNGEKITYTGDPLKDFIMVRFLDRFVFKNPRNISENPDQGGAHPTFGKRKFYKPKGVKMLAVNSRSYLNEDRSNIPVDEMFLYSYLQRKNQYNNVKDENDDNSDLESVQSEEFEEMLDKMAGFENNDEEEEEKEVDFMNEIGNSLKKKLKKKHSRNDTESSEDDQLSEDDENLEATEEDLELIDDLSEDENDEELDFNSDSEAEDDDDEAPAAKKKKKNDINSLFASADEFASLLEDEGAQKSKSGTSNAMANKDRANQKQLLWEQKRNTWIKGYNNAVKGGGGANKFKPNNNNNNYNRNKGKKFSK